MKLDDFVGKNTKIWEILTKTGKFWLVFTKMQFSQNHAGTDFFFKNDATVGGWNLDQRYL